MFFVPYVFILILYLLLALPVTSNKLSQKYKIDKYFFIFYIFFIFFCFRGFLFTDYYNYFPVYDNIKTKEFINNPIKFLQTTNQEVGFSLFVVLCKLIFKDYFFLQGLSSFIDLVILFYVFKKLVPEKIGLCFVFFIVFKGIEIEFNLLRNSKAIVLFLLSILYLNKKNYKKYILLNLLGFFFHSSALIYILITPFLLYKPKKYFPYILFIVGLGIYLLQIPILAGVLRFITSINFTNSAHRVQEIVYRYLSGDRMGIGITIGFIERTFTFIVFLKFRKRLINKNNINHYFYQIYYLLFITQYFFTEIPIFNLRISVLFYVSYWIIYPQIFEFLKKEIKAIYLMLIFLYGFLLFYSSYTIPLFQYRFFFQDINKYEDRVKIVKNFMHL